MSSFYANGLEQLDLALEQLKRGDPHSARFALVLTDNIIELMAHQIAEATLHKLIGDDFSVRKRIPAEYPHRSALKAALGRIFHSKVTFARLLGKISDEQAASLSILHTFRNELYHVGMCHEGVLLFIARFYLALTCEIVRFYEPPNEWYEPHIADRIKHYFKNGKPEEKPRDFYEAFKVIRNQSGHDSATLIARLANHVDGITDGVRDMLDEIASWKRITVDHAVVYCQYFSNKTAKQIDIYVEKNFSGTPEQRSGWIESNYPFQFRDDPTQKWHSLAGKIRQEDNPHVALKVYRDFIDETDSLREGIGLVWDHIQDILSADYYDDDYEYDDHASPISG